MTITPLRLAALVAALALGAAACGSDEEASGTTASTIAAAEAAESAAATTAAPATDAPATDAPSEAGPLVAALADDMMGEAASGASPITNRAEAECWANGIVDGVGEARLTELGVTPEAVGDLDELALTEDEVSVVVDALFGCADVQSAFAASFSEQFGDEAAQCFAEQLDPALVKEILGAQLTGGQPTQEAFAKFEEIAAGCGIGD